jgi:hypothetical protein
MGGGVSHILLFVILGLPKAGEEAKNRHASFAQHDNHNSLLVEAIPRPWRDVPHESPLQLNPLKKQLFESFFSDASAMGIVVRQAHHPELVEGLKQYKHRHFLQNESLG